MGNFKARIRINQRTIPHKRDMQNKTTPSSRYPICFPADFKSSTSSEILPDLCIKNANSIPERHTARIEKIVL
jgi:hypothetical protein